MLEFIRETGRKSKNGHRYGLYKCLECPEQTLKEILITNVNDGGVKSCGCSRIKHGMYGTTEYNSWRGMKNRCYNKNYSKYKDYGGRGISICPRWLDSFKEFYKDMGNKPLPKLSIERRDNDGNYEPENCYWGTAKEQANNRRKAIYKTRRVL